MPSIIPPPPPGFEYDPAPVTQSLPPTSNGVIPPPPGFEFDDPADRVNAKMDNLDRSIGTIASDLLAKAAKPVTDFGKDIGNALVSGGAKTGVMAHATTWLADGSPEGADSLAEAIATNAEAAAARPEYATQFDKDIKDAGWRYEHGEGIRDYASAVGETIGTVLTSPRPVANTVAEQISNFGPAAAAGAAGAYAGSLAGPVGTLVGGGAGMFVGGVATETGAKVLDLISETGVDLRNKAAVAAVLKSPGFRQAAAKAGLIKGGVIAGVDVATMGVGRKILAGPAKALEEQATTLLGRMGVDLSDKAAVDAALSDPQVKAILATAFAKYEAASATGRKVARGTAAMGVETLGEGAGEGLGQIASGGQTSFEDIVGEMVGGFGQSAAQAATSGSIGAANRITGQTSTNRDTAPPGSAPDAQTLDGEPSVEDLIGEPVSRMDSTSGTPTPDGGTTAPGAELPAFMPAPTQLSPADQRIRQIRDAINAGQPVPPSERNQAQEVPVEDVELAPAPTDPALIDAADELRAQMREPAPASNIDVDEQERTVTPVELAPPPVEQPSPIETPASNIDVSQPFDDIENIDAAPAPQPQRALPSPALAVDREGNAQPQAQADQERRVFTQKERVQYEHMQKRAAKLEAQGDVEGAIAIRRKMVGLEQQTVVQPIKALPAPVMAVDSAGNAALQSERDNADAKKKAELADIERRAAELERTDPEAALAMRRDAAGYQQTEGDNARAARSRAERLPPDWTDNRLARAAYRYGLRHMADNLEKGGGIAYKQDENGAITGRTPSLNSAWYQSMQQNPDYKMSVAQVKDAVKKALAGEKLGVREARMVGVMIDQMHGERSEQVDYAKQQLEAARTFRKTAAEAIGITDDDVEQAGELLEEREYRASWDGQTRSLYELADDASAVDAKATQAILESSASDTDVARQLLGVIHGRTQRAPEADPAKAAGERQAQAPAQAQASQSNAPRPEDEAIASYTAADLAARETQKENAETERRNAEARSAADDARGDFALTGSDSTADTAAAAGQQDLLASRPADKQGLYVEFGGRRYSVASMEEASDKWNQVVSTSGAGASEIGGQAFVTDHDGKQVARISYNGRLWEPGEGGKEIVPKGRLDAKAALTEARKKSDAIAKEFEAKSLPASEIVPEKRDPADIIKKIPPAILRRIKVKIEQLHEGEGVKRVEVSATDALKDIRRETAAFKKLLDCVSR